MTAVCMVYIFPSFYFQLFSVSLCFRYTMYKWHVVGFIKNPAWYFCLSVGEFNSVTFNVISDIFLFKSAMIFYMYCSISHCPDGWLHASFSSFSVFRVCYIFYWSVFPFYSWTILLVIISLRSQYLLWFQKYMFFSIIHN